MTAVVCGVDVGGSGIRAAVRAVRAAGEERRTAVERAVHQGSSIDPLALAGSIVQVVGRLGAPAADVICIGMTGFPGLVDDPEGIALQVMATTSARCVIVAGDSLTTHVGALAMRPGTVVAAGTGVIALGTDHRTRWNRVDGWGHLVGDEGSGTWIGRAGLAAGMRAHDGRGGSLALLEAIRAQYGDIPSLLSAIYENGSPAYELARFAPVVADAARDGDPVAAGIWLDAARRLAETAVAASEGIEPVFSWGGGLFRREELLLEPFMQAVREQVPDARFEDPNGGSLEGALRLAERFAEDDDVDFGGYARVYSQ